MSPFLSGALGALAVLVTLAVVRRWAWHRHRRRAAGQGLPLRFLYRRLGTRPDQEREIAAAAEALAGELRALRSDLGSVRDELADLVAAPAVDAGAVQAAFDARITRVSAIRGRLAESLTRIHASLDPSQRATLAELVRRGGRGRRCAHGHA